MNKVFTYAKVAGILSAILMAVVFVGSIFFDQNLSEDICGLAFIIIKLLFIIFFILLLCCSAKRSPVRISAWLYLGGLMALLLSLLADSVTSEQTPLVICISWVLLSTLAFITLSRHFSKGSTVKVLCYGMAMDPYIMILSLLYNCLGFMHIIPTLFFLAFSKLNTEIHDRQ